MSSLILIYGNLRGIREAGSYFAVPTYFYVVMLAATIVIGYYKKIVGTLHLHPPAARRSCSSTGASATRATALLMGLAFLTLLRAYANGGSSLTGLEAISNGVASFRRPESPNARITLVVMSSILAFLLAGHDAARALDPRPALRGRLADRRRPGGGRRVRRARPRPRRSSSWCSSPPSSSSTPGATRPSTASPSSPTTWRRDRYLPRQLTKRGHRLAFSNGIIVLGVVSLTLIIAFNASVERPDRALRHRGLHRLHPGRRGDGRAPPAREDGPLARGASSSTRCRRR